jgi:hypothetical protein
MKYGRAGVIQVLEAFFRVYSSRRASVSPLTAGSLPGTHDSLVGFRVSWNTLGADFGLESSNIFFPIGNSFLPLKAIAKEISVFNVLEPSIVLTEKSSYNNDVLFSSWLLI